MKKIYLSLLALLWMAGQAQTIAVSFTGRDANTGTYVQLTRVEITNQTRGWTHVLTYPDTIAALTEGTGIDVNSGAIFGFSQNTPNPFSGTTYVNLLLPKGGALTLEVCDVNGRVAVSRSFASIPPGLHVLRVNLAAVGVYLLTARQDGQISSVRMINQRGGGENSMELVGLQDIPKIKGNGRGTLDHPFVYGDSMIYKGYATISGQEFESEIVAQTQLQSETITLFFTTLYDGQPCLGTPTVTDIDGNVYTTVQIGNQCWMKENLRTTHYADGTAIPAGTTCSTSVAYRYTPNNNESTVATHGYLYNWPAVMHGAASSSANPSNVQGICPAGWHMPSHDEWTQLTTYVHDNGYQCLGCNSINWWSCVDCIAKPMAAQTGWYCDSIDICAPGNELSTNNATGFSALPAGYYPAANAFGFDAYFWSTTQYDGSTAFFRSLNNVSEFVWFNANDKAEGYSVRCVLGTAITLPTVTTDSVGTVTDTTATCGGTVTADGNAAVTMRGVCWNTLPNPTVNDSYTVDGTGLGVFNSRMTGLASGTIYYVRAYATNSAGTAYGTARTFTTKFKVITSSVSVITTSAVVCGGTVNSAGNAEVTMRGVCWDTMPNPTLNSNHTIDGAGVGTFTSNITGLTAGTTFYVRAYATYSEGTVFGNEIIFSTTDTTPTVTTKSAICYLTDTSAISGGNVTFDGGAVVTMRGICWDTLQNPTVSGSHTTDGTGMGNFTSSMTRLTPGTTYYVRAYATNNVGTTYGEEFSFRTYRSCPGAATVTDHEGNIYNTVQIGNQCWTRENMRCTTSPSTGTTILEFPADLYSNTGKKAYYVNGDSTNTLTYGLLYNWNAAIDTFHTAYGETSNDMDSVLNVTFNGHRRGICPAGWHVPSEAEWIQLTTYVYNNGYQCYGCSGSNTAVTVDCIAKALASHTGWVHSSNTYAVGNDPTINNATGFSAVPAGYHNGDYCAFSSSTYFWSSTQSNNASWARCDYIPYYTNYTSHKESFKKCGNSVRCIRD